MDVLFRVGYDRRLTDIGTCQLDVFVLLRILTLESDDCHLFIIMSGNCCGSAERINSLAVQVLCRDMDVLEVVFAGSALVLHW